MSLAMRRKRNFASRPAKNDTTYRRKSICVARKKIKVTKKSNVWATAGVTNAMTGVTMPNFDGSTAMLAPDDGSTRSCNSRKAAKGLSST